MTSIENSRTSRFSKYFANNAEYASKVKHPLGINEHSHTGQDELSPSPKQLRGFDLPSVLDRIKSAGDPHIILSLHGNYYNEQNGHWKGYVSLTDALTKIPRCTERCGIIYDAKENAILGTIVGHNKLLQESDIAYGFFSFDPERPMENTGEEKVKGKAHERRGYVYNKNRLLIERAVNKQMKRNFQENNDMVRVPVVLILANGDLMALEHVARAVDDDISVVVLKGSGGAADLIALCLEKVVSLRKEAPVILATRFDKTTYSKLEEVTKFILEKDWLVNIFDLKVDSYDMLWDRITNGIMRAWSCEQNKDLADDGNLGKEPMFEGNIVSISEYVVGLNWLTKTELFGGYCIESPTDKIRNAFYNAILGNDTKSIRQLINHYKDLKLSIEEIKILYKQVMESPQNYGNTTVNILQSGWDLQVPNKLKEIRPRPRNPKHICPEASRFLTVSADTPTSRPDFNDAVQSIANKLLYGFSFSKISIIKYCKSLRKRKTEESNDDPDEVLRWSVFTNNWENAGIFWSTSTNPILSALISSCYLYSMAQKADELFKDSQSIYNHPRRFVKRAECLLDMLFKHNENMATDALEHVTEVWGHAESALHFAQQFGMEEFISNSSIQKDANKKLYGYKSDRGEDKSYNSINSQDHIKNTEPTHREPDNDFLSFITHHYRKKETWKYLTAPLAKISIQFLVFLTSLIMFSIFLCTNLNVGVISELEIIVFVIMVGDFLEEMWSMLRCYHECRWSPARIVLHLFDIWNFLDMLCFVLYFIGFGIHLTASEELLTHVRRIYSIALFIMFFRILNIFLMFKRIGIIVIMVKEMLVDLWRYLLIFLVLIVAAGVVYHANLYPNHTLTIGRIRTVLKIPYWQVYGELNLDTLEGSDQLCTNNSTLWNADPTVERCPEGDWITSFIAAFYMMLTNWLLLNIVISMFSSRYQKVKEKSEQKWLYHRHSVIINYEHWIPSPFNFILRPIARIYQLTLCPCSTTRKQGHVNTMLEKQKEFAKEIIENEDKHDYS